MTLGTSWFTDVHLLDNEQLCEAILGWGRDGKTGVGCDGVDVNGEGIVGKVSGCYLTGKARRSKTNMLSSRRVTICTHPLSPPQHCPALVPPHPPPFLAEALSIMSLILLAVSCHLERLLTPPREIISQYQLSLGLCIHTFTQGLLWVVLP